MVLHAFICSFIIIVFQDQNSTKVTVAGAITLTIPITIPTTLIICSLRLTFVGSLCIFFLIS